MTNGLKIGSMVAIIGLIAYLFIRIEGYKNANAKLHQDINGVNWLLEAKEKENDILREFGEYAIPDTVWDSIPIPYPVHDTLPPDTFYAAIPRIWGHFEIDTVVGLGLRANPLYVRVEGEVYYPKKYESLNWLKVYQDSLDSWNPPPLPQKDYKVPRYGIGLGIAFKTSQGAHIGLQGRFGKTSLGLFYDPWRKVGLAMVGYEVLRF